MHVRMSAFKFAPSTVYGLLLLQLS